MKIGLIDADGKHRKSSSGLGAYSNEELMQEMHNRGLQVETDVRLILP